MPHPQAPSRDIDGKRYRVQGDSKRRGINLTNPFLLSNDAGIQYYANETLNGGHLLTMLANAKGAADYVLDLAERRRDYLAAVSEILAQENQNRETLESRQRFLLLVAVLVPMPRPELFAETVARDHALLITIDDGLEL